VEAGPPRHARRRLQAQRHRRPSQREVLQLARQGVAGRLPARLRPRRYDGRGRRLGAAAGRAALREAGRKRSDHLPRVVRRAGRPRRPDVGTVQALGAVAEGA
jgi:hypothetical protein